MEARTSFVFYRSFFEAAALLPEAEQAAFFMALCRYALEGTEPELPGALAALFLMARPILDANQQRYENGKKGGRPRQEKPAGAGRENHPETTPEPDGNENGNENENENVSADGNGPAMAGGGRRAAERPRRREKKKGLGKDACRETPETKRAGMEAMERYLLQLREEARAQAEAPD